MHGALPLFFSFLFIILSQELRVFEFNMSWWQMYVEVYSEDGLNEIM